MAGIAARLRMAATTALAVCALAVAGQRPARAQPQPLWELGLGAAAVAMPDYVGAGERQLRALPVPYFVYRGRRVQADRDGIYLFGSRRIELDVTFDASPPVGEGDNRARRGMPALLPAAEAGPALNLVLAADAGKRRALLLRLGARVAVASDLRAWDWLGVTAAPELAFRLRSRDLKATLSIGPLFATEGVHDRTYQVAPAYAVPGRPAYDARGGYGGARALLRGGWQAGRLWLGWFARFDELHGATFADSPLVRSRHAFAAGGAVAWIFARSRRAGAPER